MYTSYAQNLEDVILQRVFAGKSEGFFIDIGAWHPERDSVTKSFYDRGWSGINVEPTAYYFKLLSKARLRDINLNVAVSGEEGSQDFYEILGSGLSSLDQSSVDRAIKHGFAVKKLTTKTMSLESIAVKYCSDQEVDFLKIDVEGYESIVLKSVNWSIFRPVVVLIESVQADTGEPAWSGWESYLLDQGYIFVWFDGLNRFYLRKESAELSKFFNCPPNVFDKFRLHKNHVLVEGHARSIGQLVKAAIPTSLLPMARTLHRRIFG